MSGNSVCHIEWAVSDLERARKFYGGLFDWKFENWGEGGEYMLWSPAEGGLGGGFMKEADPSPGASPAVYVTVASVEASLKKAAELGGTVHIPKTPIPNVGWFGIVKDLDGNAVGLLEPLPRT